MACDYVSMFEYCSYVALVKLGVKPLLPRGSFKSPRGHVTNNEDLKSKTADKTTIAFEKSQEKDKDKDPGGCENPLSDETESVTE